MNTQNTAASAAISADFPAIPMQPGVVRRWLVPGLSLIILAAALWQLRSVRVAELVATLPRSGWFWAIFLLGYFVTPLSELLIFRRLWGLPLSGLLPLLRKRVSNEIIVGYSGEVYFYAWARRHARLTAAPFGAIKDVSILSAVVANLCTMALAIVCWRQLHDIPLGASTPVLAGSAFVIGLPSVLALMMRRRVLSLPGKDLRMIAGVHFARLVLTTLINALTWALVLPAAPIVWWVALAVLRLLVSRLPLLPNKDIIFAGLVAFAVGQSSMVTEMLAMLAALTLLTHLLIGAALSAAEVIAPEPRA